MDTLNSTALKKIMIEQGIGVSELATKINSRPTTVGEYIKADSKVRIPTLKKLADALNVDPFTLIYGGV